MWIVNLILTILLLIFFLYMFVRIKMYVDAATNALEDYINGIKDVMAEVFKKLSDKLNSREKVKNQAVIRLTQLVNRLKHTETEYDVLQHFYIIQGYATCCKECGYLNEDDYIELLQLSEHMADTEINRIRDNEK